MLAPVVDVKTAVNPVGAKQLGGDQVKERPDAGKIVEVSVEVEVFNVPAVVAAQLVVVVLLLKSVFAPPLKPTCVVILVVENM